MKIAVLALQGAFVEHERMLSKIGISSFEVRQRSDLHKSFDGLILPGGESTVQGDLMKELGIYQPIRERIVSGLPVFGTCAGLILLANHIENDNRSHLATMDITVVRNGYGRQLGSFYTETDFKGLGTIPMTFIRAPYIDAVHGEAEVLAVVNGRIVAARQNNQLVTAFHPELTDDLSVHTLFSDMITHCKSI